MLRDAYKYYRTGVKGNKYGRTTALITENAVLERWLGFTPTCGVTGLTTELRLVPSRPGPFDNSNMRLVHKGLLQYFRFDGSDADCYCSRFGSGGDGLGASNVVAATTGTDRRPRPPLRWTQRSPLRFKVLEYISQVMPAPVANSRGELEDKSAAALRCRAVEGDEALIVLAQGGAALFLCDFVDCGAVWELPGVEAAQIWDFDRKNGIVHVLIPQLPCRGPLVYMARARMHLVSTELSMAPERALQLRLQSVLYGVFGALYDALQPSATEEWLKNELDARGAASLMRAVVPPPDGIEPVPRFEPALLNAEARAFIGAQDDVVYDALCAAREIADNCEEDAKIPEEGYAEVYVQQQLHLDFKNGVMPDGVRARLVATTALQLVLKAGMMRRVGHGVLSW